MNIEARLDKARQRFMDNDFLRNRGLSNEVGLYIFQYDPRDELAVRAFVQKISEEFDGKSSEIRIIAYDLYQILLDICRERRIIDRIPAMEIQQGRQVIREQLQKVARPETFVEHMKYEGQRVGDIVLLHGVGKVFPYVRAHNILNNLQHVFNKVPVVLFYPGEYNGQSLILFGELFDNHYYRAFNLI